MFDTNNNVFIYLWEISEECSRIYNGWMVASFRDKLQKLIFTLSVGSSFFTLKEIVEMKMFVNKNNYYTPDMEQIVDESIRQIENFSFFNSSCFL